MQNRNFPSLFAAAIAAATLGLGVCGSAYAQQTDAAQTQSQDPGSGAVAILAATGTATVKAVDAKNRTVTLEAPDGAVATIKCDKEVINFDQIKAGDQIRATAIDRVALVVGKGGAPSAGEGAAVALAAKGEKPGIIIADTAEITDKVEAVDAANHTITLQGVEGKPETFKVAPSVDLSGVKKGDDIVLRCTEGLALVDEGPRDAAAAQPAAAALKPQAGEGAMALDVATATATVESVDPAKRTVTLKNAEGDTRTVRLGKNVINFDQIKTGDKVKATLAEQVAVGITKGGAPPSAAAGQVVALAAKGEKPGMIIADTEQVTGKIDAVDAAKGTVTLSLPEGQPVTLKVSKKVKLDDLKAGDDVTAQVTQAFAIIVEAP